MHLQNLKAHIYGTNMIFSCNCESKTWMYKILDENVDRLNETAFLVI